MLSITKHPQPKHGQTLKNPGFSGKMNPIVKIKAVKVSTKKKGGKRKKRNITNKHKKYGKTRKNKTRRRKY